jgi:photosystem II stability/assembly factor-like uncharacterized protein
MSVGLSKGVAKLMLYIGTDEGIYRWFSGANWPIFHGLQDRGIVGLASSGRGVLAALDGSGRVLESTNNGLDWAEVPAPEGVGRATFLAATGAPAELLLATSRPLGLYRRPVGLVIEEAGASRGPLDFARRLVPSWLGGAREMGGTATATVAPGTRNLHGWEPLVAPAVEADASGVAPEVRSLVSDGSRLFAAITGAGLWRSEDAGATWSRCEGLTGEVFAMRAPGTPEGLVVAGTSEGVQISTDGGQTWADSSAGLEGARRVRAVEIKPGDSKVMLAGAAPSTLGEGGPVAARGGLTRFALYESKDGGKTWKHTPRGFPEVLEYDQIADIRYDPADPDSAVIALASGEMWNTRTDGLWWEPLARQIKTARVLCAVS